ncbi:MAG TPA: 50S ribosomal protein L21 [Candidatus Omnitrophota bacterium]|nr:50S ribosomal protein L21 [Candidatus Omnitrophota bacterium]HQJ15221.1 50S ribosomal protein L21 [Candidatus Omnitrophota bacterium]
MYAVIAISGKQFVVKEGDTIEVDRQQVEAGKSITIKDVLLVADGDNVIIGQPVVGQASVQAEALAHTRGDKLITFKYRRRKSSHTKKGHRQDLTRLLIRKIAAG